MCYLVAKDRDAHGCFALKTTHGKHLVELKRELNKAVGYKGVPVSYTHLDGNEIKCKFDQLLRWREISLLMGQDFFTCAYLAYDDWKKRCV